MKRSIGLLIALSALSACTNPPSTPGSFFPTDAVADISRDGGTLPGNQGARDLVTPKGANIPQRSPPFQATATVADGSDGDGINVIASFAEGEPAAYLAPEMWSGWAPVWVQPLYVLVTAWVPSDPLSKFLPGSKPIFAVDTTSTFYSPFWRVEFVVVPASTNPTSLTSAKQLLDGGFARHRGPFKVCTLSKRKYSVSTSAAGPAVRPLDGSTIGPVLFGDGFVDGESWQVADFGTDGFTVDANDIVEEVPMLVPSRRDATGAVTPLGLPTVLGVGPLFSGRRALAPRNRPSFGSWWRLVRWEVPASAAVLVTPDLTALKERFVGRGLKVPDLAPEVAARPDIKKYLLRIALDGACFQDAVGFPGSCSWLDSQARVEAALSQQSFHPQPEVANRPMVQFLGQPVPNP